MRGAQQAEGLTLRKADNKTGYFGVYLNNPSRPKPFMALVRHSGKLVHLGSFATAEEAALCVARSLEGQVAVQETVAAPPLTGDDDGDDDAGEEDEDTVETVVLDAVEVLVASDDGGDEMQHLPRPTSNLPNQGMATSCGRLTLPGPLPQAIEINVAPTSSLTLREQFDTLVMVNYTPRSPTKLPMAQWASYRELLCLFEIHAPTVRQTGPGNLKQLIIGWFKDHPAFAGLEAKKWCKKLTDNDPQAPPRSQVFKFPFEYTPGGQPQTMPLMDQMASRKRGLCSITVACLAGLGPVV